MSRILLKARPVPSQLDDRLREPRPDGLELYLDTADLADDAAMRAAADAIRARDLGNEFNLLIEGPVRSLDGEFFDPARQAEADREVVRRLAQLAAQLGAEAVNIHLISPTADPAELNAEIRQAKLERSLDLMRFFVDEISSSGAVPTIENMPPILRMRQSGFFYSAVGMAAEDLTWCCQQVGGLRTTLDISHAGLYINCQKYASMGRAECQGENIAEQLLAFVRTLPRVETVRQYAAALGPTLLTCHVANAEGLLGEGEPYDRGDLPLDKLVSELSPYVRYFVTETLEADQNQAVEMRRAMQGMRRVLSSSAV